MGPRVEDRVEANVRPYTAGPAHTLRTERPPPGADVERGATCPAGVVAGDGRNAAVAPGPGSRPGNQGSSDPASGPTQGETGGKHPFARAWEAFRAPWAGSRVFGPLRGRVGGASAAPSGGQAVRTAAGDLSSVHAEAAFVALGCSRFAARGAFGTGTGDATGVGLTAT